MIILFEEHTYKTEILKKVFGEIESFHKASESQVKFVGYFFNKDLNDCVFILPKVLLTDATIEKGSTKREEYLVDDGNYIKPEDVIYPIDQEHNLSEKYRNFIYDFSVWIYQAIKVFQKRNPKSDALVYEGILNETSRDKRKSNTVLDLILNLKRFNSENQDFFIQTIKNIHCGHNRINWNKTVSNGEVIIDDGIPIYINPINKKNVINFDEELLIIYFSLLNYINKTYSFNIPINYNYDLIPVKRFNKYIQKGLGKRRLKEIRYKYFSDKSIDLWNLCYAFFDHSYKIRLYGHKNECLLIKNFFVVFESIIDTLIGEENSSIPDGLKDQKDGKRIDHLYFDRSLLSEEGNDRLSYYIGDSKYYKIGYSLGCTDISKQFTYARNLIQWNSEIFGNLDNINNKKAIKKVKELNNGFSNVRVRNFEDDFTEGYDIIPNFFISALIDIDRHYDDGDCNIHVRENNPNDPLVYISKQFNNRLFDRDTFIVNYFDVNFLYILVLYAQNKQYAQEQWKRKARKVIRKEVQGYLVNHYKFFVLSPKFDDLSIDFIKHRLTSYRGKISKPFKDQNLICLALENGYDENNSELISDLVGYFNIKPYDLGTEII